MHEILFMKISAAIFRYFSKFLCTFFPCEHPLILIPIIPNFMIYIRLVVRANFPPPLLESECSMLIPFWSSWPPKTTLIHSNQKRAKMLGSFSLFSGLLDSLWAKFVPKISDIILPKLSHSTVPTFLSWITGPNYEIWKYESQVRQFRI